MNIFNRAILVFLGFTIVLCTILSCNSDKKKNDFTSKNPMEKLKSTKDKNDKKNILFYGNSLTAGYGLNEDQSFPSLIQGYIDSLEMSYHVINGGLSGETTSGGRERIDWVLQQPIDVFVLELGANDMLRGLDLKATKANLNAIILKVKKQYPEVILFLAEMKAAPNMGSQYVLEFSKIYKDLSKSHDIYLIPFFLEGVAENDALLLPDGKHPNADGQKIVAQNIWNSMKKQL